MFQDIPILSLIERVGDPDLDAPAAVKVLREKAVVPATKLAVKNFDTWKKLAEAKHKESKALIAAVAKKVEEMEDPDWIPSIYAIGEVKGAVDILRLTAKHLKEQNKAYAEAFNDGGFRGDWRKTIRAAFPQLEEGDIEQAIGGPLKIRGQIIARNRAVIATRSRVEEYLKRSAILYRTAENSRKAASKSLIGAHRAVGKSIADADKHIKTCEGAVEKVEKKLKTLKDLLKTKPKKWETMAEGVAAERDENARKARGGLKTLNQELVLASKVLEKTPQTPRELADQLAARQQTATDLENDIEELVDQIQAQNKQLKRENIKV